MMRPPPAGGWVALGTVVATAGVMVLFLVSTSGLFGFLLSPAGGAPFRTGSGTWYCGQPNNRSVCLSAYASGGTSPYSFAWNFGDGSPSCQSQSVDHVYSNFGTYTGSLRESDSGGNVAFTTVDIQITPQAPQVNISAVSGEPPPGYTLC